LCRLLGALYGKEVLNLMWITLISLSALFGFLLGMYKAGKWSAIMSGFIPCGIFQLFIFYDMYFVPYQGGGAPMWLVAQIFGGFVTFVTGILSYFLTNLVRRR